jgi:hypothetical protein
MANTGKGLSDRDANQTLQHAYNAVDASITTAGFLVGKVGHKVTMAISTTSAANDTQTYTFLDNGTTLYAIKLIYTDNTYATLVSAERIS